MTTRCKYCQRLIQWAEIEGKRIPLDARATTYEFNDGVWVRSKGYVIHVPFCTGQIENKTPPQRSLPYADD